MKTLLSFILLFAIFVSCNSSNTPDAIDYATKVAIPKVATDHTAIDNAEYWITFPKTWRQEGDEGNGTVFTLYAPTNEDEMFEDNLSLGLEDMPTTSVTPEEYLASAKTMIGNVIENFIVLEEENVRNKHAPGRKIEYTGNIQGLEAKWKQYVYIKNKKAYVLTFTCLNTPEAIKKHDAASDKILNSFIIK